MGELPRSMQLVVDRTLVGTIAPGTRVTAVGIYSIYQARRAAAAGLSRACCPQGPSRLEGMARLQVHISNQDTGCLHGVRALAESMQSLLGLTFTLINTVSCNACRAGRQGEGRAQGCERGGAAHAVPARGGPAGAGRGRAWHARLHVRPHAARLSPLCELHSSTHRRAAK